MPKPIFIALAALDEGHFIGYLRERGWRVEPDEVQPFGVTCHPPDDPPGGCGYHLVEAVVRQSEQELRVLFDYLEQQRHPRQPIRKEPPDAQPSAGQPG
jgi:hypothetical protein